MQFDSIQTPADLVKANDEMKQYAEELNINSPSDEVLEAILELDYEAMDNLIYALLQHQVNFHKEILSANPKGINRESIIGNLSKLRTIRDLYGEI